MDHMGSKFVKGFGILFLCLTVAIASAASRIRNINLQVTSTRTQVIVQTDQQVGFRVFTLTNPNRVVVDLQNTVGAEVVRRASTQGSAVTNLRASEDAAHLRMVMDIARPRSVSGQWISVGRNQRPQFVLSVDSAPIAQGKTVVQAAQPVTRPKPEPLPVVKLSPGKSTQMPRQNRDVIVVIDPGHGGKDPGAAGRGRSREKDIVLQISRELARLVNQQPGMRAMLTRTSDYYIPLRGRLNLARKYNGDIFISIHADAYRNMHSHGASVFALSQRGATSEAAHWLAEKENYSELGGVDLSELNDRDGMIRSVLLDLSQTATIGSSLQLGDYILGNLRRMTRLHNQRVEQARFMVLKSPDIPSVLVETGFISNPNEERKLRNARYQQQLAQAILVGLTRYFYANPPMDSYIALHRNSRSART